MKSSKDIEPRVGMQVFNFFYEDRQKISAIDHVVWFFGGSQEFCYLPGNKGDWDMGKFEIEWIPPTDEERKLFVEAANVYDSGDAAFKCDSDSDGRFVHEPGIGVFANHVNCLCNSHMKSICLSLALDGADYDNMPEGFV